MMFEDFYARLHSFALVPVVVLEDEADAAPLAHALRKAGLASAEVTFRTQAAASAISAMKCAEPELCVGAGTVLDHEQLLCAFDAGAEFIVSPGFDRELVEECLDKGAPVLPGCVTPTEISTARKLGLGVTKFFPASVFGGVSAIKALSAPFGTHRFMPTGGVSAKNLADYLKNPAVIACGGSWMVAPSLIRDHRFDEIERLCREAAALIKSLRPAS